jgi:hypothetical protein
MSSFRLINKLKVNEIRVNKITIEGGAVNTNGSHGIFGATFSGVQQYEIVVPIIAGANIHSSSLTIGEIFADYLTTVKKTSFQSPLSNQSDVLEVHYKTTQGTGGTTNPDGIKNVRMNGDARFTQNANDVNTQSNTKNSITTTQNNYVLVDAAINASGRPVGGSKNLLGNETNKITVETHGNASANGSVMIRIGHSYSAYQTKF